jgi:hypothetical protein
LDTTATEIRINDRRAGTVTALVNVVPGFVNVVLGVVNVVFVLVTPLTLSATRVEESAGREALRLHARLGSRHTSEALRTSPKRRHDGHDDRTRRPL